MGTNVTSSSGSVLKEPEIQKLQMQAKIFKENSLNKLNTLKSTTQLLKRQTFSGCLLSFSSDSRSQEKTSRDSTKMTAQTFKETNHPNMRTPIEQYEEIDKQELEAHYGFMAKIQEVLPAESSSTDTPLEQVQNNDEKNVFANERQHSEKHAAECADERAALANLIANLTLDTEENKTILKQLKKANASLPLEMENCLIALQNKQNEFEKYKAFNDRTIDYEILQTKLNETLGLLALKDIEIKEGLKTKAYEISVLNQKHDELVKKSLLTRSQLEGYLKENTKVISDLKSIQTIHMLAPKCATYNGRLTFANPRYLKKAQSEKPCLYEIPYDTSDPANRFAPNREETMTLDNESRSKLDKETVKPYDYTRQNSLYEIFKAPSLEYLYQLERAKEVRKTMWRKPFVRTKPNIAKNVAFLPVSKSISKMKPQRKANKSVATPHKKIVASDTTIQKPKSYFKELYENTNKAWKWWIEKKCPSEYKWTQTTPSRPNLKWKPTGRIFSNVRFKWIPTGKLFNSCALSRLT
ncbi:hypothetical protein Tco_0509087 [Tanacetum coccineum]